MRNLKTLSRLIVVFLVLFASISRADELTIVGEWVSADRTKGGLGSTLIFLEDGKVISIFGALVDFRYRVEGTIIKTIYLGADGSKDDEISPQSFVLDGDKLILEPNDPEKRQEMLRAIGSPQSKEQPVVGIWSFKHYTGAMATMQYMRDGRARLSVPFLRDEGKYEIRGEMITLIFNGSPALTRKGRLNKTDLILDAQEAKNEARYLRHIP